MLSHLLPSRLSPRLSPRPSQHWSSCSSSPLFSGLLPRLLELPLGRGSSRLQPLAPSGQPVRLKLGKLGLGGLKLGGLGAIAAVLVVNPAQALEMRVAIEENAQQVQIGASTNAVVKDAATGRSLGAIQPLNGDTAQVQGGQIQYGTWRAGQIWVEPSQDGFVWIGNPKSSNPAERGRYYRGRVLLIPTAKGLTAVNYVDLEEYLYSVVASEMPSSWPLEALKAQSVAARSYALARRDKTANPVYDVGDTTFFQVYKGVEAETTSTQTAVRATAGQVLSYNGQIIEAVFHSSSGGSTENVEDIWSQPLPYLRSVQDFDLDPSVSNPHATWTEAIAADDMLRKLSTRMESLAQLGRIVALEPLKTTAQGRIRRLRLIGEQGRSQEVSGEQFRQALQLKSTRFTIDSTPGTKATEPSGFVFEGSGFGHGLGMSQYGAYAMANNKANYRQILGHYYKGAMLSRIRVVQ